MCEACDYMTDDEGEYDPEGADERRRKAEEEEETPEPNDAFQRAAATARELIRQQREEEAEEEDDDEEEDDEPSRAEAYDVMTPTQFNAHRLEAWEMAYTALTKKDGSERNWGDDYKVDPSDVLILARFIEGDDLGD